MSIKKISFLVTSALVFFIVMTSTINVIKYNSYKSNEYVNITMNYKILPDKMFSSYNFIEVEKKVEEFSISDSQKNVDTKEIIVENSDIPEESSKETIFVGKMTGYGSDCIGCNGVGTLACKTYSGTIHSLAIDGEYYNDNTYGKIRIVAADLSKFPCGTIVKISNDNLGEFYAVVLDTGGSVQRAWENGTVWMDLAFKTESDPLIYSATSNNTTYVVQRWGW